MAVTFTRTTRTEDRSTGQFTVATSTITGTAIKVTGDPVRYRARGLVESEAPTLFFVAEGYATGDVVSPGDTTVWGGITYTARDVSSFAPDSVPITSRVIVER